MKIRSITAFADIEYPLGTGAISLLGEALRETKNALAAQGYEVQTTRIATSPFPETFLGAGPGMVVDFAKDLAALAFVHEIDYISLGPVRLIDPASFIDVIPEVLKATENVFATVEVANNEIGINLPRVRRAADVIRQIASVSPDGFANLRFAVLANVAPWSPFFPAAYHGGGGSCIAIATESADLAVSVISGAQTLKDAKETLIGVVESEAGRIESAVKKAVEPLGVGFKGIDFSLAPFPADARSIGNALEKLGLSSFGDQGSLMSAAFLTAALDSAKFSRTGFCGLMLPLLEDSILAQRGVDTNLSVSELLLYSAVCGTGIDTIPLPGNISEGTVAATLLDVSAMSLRLNKPLTARLMPLPGKSAGQMTEFDFEYFVNSRVLSPSTGSLNGLLAGDETISILPISSRR